MITKLWTLKITHKPTGIVVKTDSTCYRSTHKAKEALLKLLKSKVWMHYKNNPYINAQFNYGVPNDDLWPNDLEIYKEEL